MTDEESPEALSVRRGFDDAELATCLKVLRALGSDGGTADATTSDGVGGGDAPDDAPGVSPLFHHKAHKQLRVALQPLLGELRGQLGHYGKDPKAFRAAKQSKRDLNRRKMQEKAADRESLNQTRMRAARLERLAALEAGHAELPLAIGDGENPSGANPSGADASAENPSAGDPSADPDQAPRRAPLPLVPDGCSGDAAASHSISDASGSSNPTILNQPRQCYVCKCRFRRLHHFYASLCPECAELNWEKRRQTADLSGRVALVTGARVKIGYRIALKLLRCGAAVVATTRFPVDARQRFEREPDAGDWLDRLTVVAMDLRDLPGLERLCAHLSSALPRLDIIVNNACQTVRRPPAYYRHLLEAEARGANAYLEASAATSVAGLLAGVGRNVGHAADDCDQSEDAEDTLTGTNGWRSGDARALRGAGWMAPSAAASQLELLPGDASASERQFPAGALDINGQQVDLREKTSWTTKLGEVETSELLEVLAVNAAAPFVLNGKLRGLMERTAASGGVDGGSCRAFVVNVSAMEGKFYRYKTANHPHTNMAKAALNMMTATAAAEYAACGIYMNAVDTGWINDENPLETAARIARDHSFQTPIDEEDAAARCVAPVLEGVRDEDETPPFGKFFKDYRESEW